MRLQACCVIQIRNNIVESCHCFISDVESGIITRGTKAGKKIGEAWDLDTLIGYAIGVLTEHYKKDREAFETDYKDLVEANQ